MKPDQLIEKYLLSSENSQPLSLEEHDKFAWLLVSVIQRAKKIFVDEKAWPGGVADYPIEFSRIKGYIDRLCKVIDSSDNPEAIAMLLFPVRRFADLASKEFFIRNLRKWFERDKLVTYNLLLCLDDIGEKPFCGKGPRGAITEEDDKANKRDALTYLDRVGRE